MNEFVTKWGHIEFKEPTEQVRRDSLKPGDIAHSSHYGEREVKRVSVQGNEGQTTYLTFVGPKGSDRVFSEAYPSDTTIPLIHRPSGWDKAWDEFRKTHADVWDGMTMRTVFEAGFAAGKAS